MDAKLRALFAAVAAISIFAGTLRVSADDVAAPEDAKVPVRGVVRTIDQAALSTDLIARVGKIGFREGEAFKKGDLLIAFDCERYKAEAQSAEAVFREMQLTLDSNEHLEKFRAVGKHDVEISKARADKAQAEARSLQSRLAQCEVAAATRRRLRDASIAQPKTRVGLQVDPGIGQAIACAINRALHRQRHWNAARTRPRDGGVFVGDGDAWLITAYVAQHPFAALRVDNKVPIEGARADKVCVAMPRQPERCESCVDLGISIHR